jgi:hypothetical protein
VKIHAICLVRNEADVIQECLLEAGEWADRIYLYDGASTDGTWELIQSMRSEKIVPWRSDNTTFREGLRALVYNDVRKDAHEGDWWCQLNGDEFYTEDPRAFLQAVPTSEHVVWGLMIQYYLTPEDVDGGAEWHGQFARDRDRIRYYRAACAERRFFRHRDRLRWDDRHAWPEHLGIVHPKLLPFRHYPYRSPQQIQMRLDVRRENRARGFEGWDHAKELTWREKIVARDTLHFDRQDGNFEIEDEVLHQHEDPPRARLVKRVLHGLKFWP